MELGRIQRYVTVAALAFCILSFAEQKPSASDKNSCPCPAPQSDASSQPETDSADSVAEAARIARTKAAHAKKVISEESLEPSLGPLPRLKMDRAENGEDVLDAIRQYKQGHTAEQTEEVVRRWYEYYDAELAAAIKSNLDIKSLREANVENGYELCVQGRDYQKCQARRQAEFTGARLDQNEIKRNTDIVVRLQHSMMYIRNGMSQLGIHYTWFKVRTTNNIDRF